MKRVLHKSAENYEAAGRLDPRGFDRHVVFHTYPPPKDLVPFVEHFWTIRWDKTGAPSYFSEQLMHKPYVDLFISSRGSGIQGTFRGKRIYVAEDSNRIVGIRFRPGGFHAFWNGKIADIQDGNYDIQDFFSDVDEGFIQTVIGLADKDAVDTLINLLRSKAPQYDVNIEILNEIIDAATTDKELNAVNAVAVKFRRSERWIQQLFLDYVGVGLKWLLQRNRLLEAARIIRENEQQDWAGLAYDMGYSSQQHFIADFKRVTGRTPLQYRKEITK